MRRDFESAHTTVQSRQVLRQKFPPSGERQVAGTPPQGPAHGIQCAETLSSDAHVDVPAQHRRQLGGKAQRREAHAAVQIQLHIPQFQSRQGLVPARHGNAAVVFQRNWRHGQAHVVGEQRDKRLNVAGLKRLDEFPDEFRGDCVLNGEPSTPSMVRFGEKGTLRLVFPINSKVAFTAEGGVNETLLARDNSGSARFGVQFGNFMRPKDYLDAGRPVPAEVPRIRYEMLTRTIRTGNSPPVADAGPDQGTSRSPRPGPVWQRRPDRIESASSTSPALLDHT